MVAVVARDDEAAATSTDDSRGDVCMCWLYS